MSPQERARFEHRISELGNRLGEARSRRDSEMSAGADAETRGRGMAYGMRMAAELVVAVVVGGGIGWSLDRVLGSRPWLFLVFFLLGFAAGVVNLMRAYERMQRDFTAKGGGIGRSMPDEDE
ncbi:MAG: AtpZ/AtpI family protein [Hyphomicrobiaceae bacterium]|nr:AtpZ/AtpI family protein [Hyphomicrobiaceae bacterium]